MFESNRSLFAGDVDEQVDEEIYDRVNQAVESLPEQCSLIIKLNVIEGKKYLEISEELGIPINTIRTQVFRDTRN
ncbi:MAG: sigma-70 family RNA polymerase sigma factor [Bacteroidales bacterium]|nr:sigma-70 family RNA polymerase sigma factor [Bacteroidales bacterium]